jgi:amino acid/amide ABC transporter substrate-binding protein, HAAT family (TC 3.A.1.4.-)
MFLTLAAQARKLAELRDLCRRIFSETTMKFFATLFAGLSLMASTSAFAATPGVTDTQIVIGQSAPLTGPAAQLGIRLRMGIEAYFKQVNADGGVAGRSLKLVSLDDGYEPAAPWPIPRPSSTAATCSPCWAMSAHPPPWRPSP